MWLKVKFGWGKSDNEKKQDEEIKAWKEFKKTWNDEQKDYLIKRELALCLYSIFLGLFFGAVFALSIARSLGVL